jgi:hypothetical protein
VPAATQTRKSAEPSQSILSRRVLVSIRRDQTTDTPRVVWAHEVPLLQLIHGEDEVKEVESKTLDEGYKAKASADVMPYNKRQDHIRPPSENMRLGWVFIGDAQSEYQRLCEAYGRHVEVNQPNCEHIYGRFGKGDFRRVLGQPTLGDLPEDQLRDLILSYGYALPLVTHESSDGERVAAEKAWAEFRGLKHEALVKLAEEVGVEIAL